MSNKDEYRRNAFGEVYLDSVSKNTISKKTHSLLRIFFLIVPTEKGGGCLEILCQKDHPQARAVSAKEPGQKPRHGTDRWKEVTPFSQETPESLP